MQAERFELTHRPASAAEQEATWFGLACAVASASPAHRARPLAALRQLLLPALRHGQIKFYFDGAGQPAAYVAWAAVAEDVEPRLLTGRPWQLHESEWNEGGAVWIVDFVARPGFARAVARDLRAQVFASLGRLRYVRTRKGRLRLHELERAPTRAALRVRRATSGN